MEFPGIVYRSPGPHAANGGTFAYAGFGDQDQLDSLLADGWCFTIEEALHGKIAETVKISDKAPTEEAPKPMRGRPRKG